MTKKLSLIALVWLGMTSLSPATVAVEVDVKGSTDHPLISRFPDTYISGYHTSEFQEFMAATGPITAAQTDADGQAALPPVKRYEGKSTVITYKAQGKDLSALAIYRNYEKAFKENGFVKTFSCRSDAECGPWFVRQLYWYGDPARRGQNDGLDAPNIRGAGYRYFYWTGTGKAAAGNYVVSLLVAQQADASFPAAIVLDINEVAALNEDRVGINLDALRNDIAAKGKVVLDGVFFDSDKATLTAQSEQAIAVIADYLTQNRSSTFYVVGHTDGKGTLAYNQSLSLARAKAVVQALQVTHSIDATRLTALGVGPASPVIANTTEAGRVLNRRVELVLRNDP